MSRFWPHSNYAEDQPHSHAILYTHVITRAAQLGSLVGAGIGTSTFLLRRFRVLAPRLPPSTLAATVLRSTGVGTVVACGLLAVALPARMRDKEEIEWQDRSWRLLENSGQVETDDWTYGGMAGGLIGAASIGKGLGWRGAIGSVGLGGLAGALGYTGYTNVIRGGPRDEKSDV